MLRDLAAAWLRKNCPNPKLQRDFMRQLDEAEQQRMNCSFVIGSGLVRNRKPYLVHCFGGEFFAFALRPHQARNLREAPGLMHYMPGSPRVDPDPGFPARVALDRLHLDHASHLCNADRITGRCRYWMEGNWLQAYCACLRYDMPDSATVASWFYPTEPLCPEGTIEFNVDPVWNPDQPGVPSWSGTTVAFLRLFTMPDGKTVEGRRPFSNTSASLMDVY
jgi:hypothetical protein